MGVEVMFLVGFVPLMKYYYRKLEKVWPYSILVVSAKPLQSAINNFSYKNTYRIFHLFNSIQYSSLFFIGVVLEERIGHIG